MKSAGLIGAMVVGLSATIALAQGVEQDAAGAWYNANILSPDGWTVVHYTPDALILRKPASGSQQVILTEARVERRIPETVGGFTWKSALITSQDDCLTKEMKVLDRQGVTSAPAGVGLSKSMAPTRQARIAKMVLFEGQNLSGASVAVPIPDGPLPESIVGRALGRICDRALADILGPPAKITLKPLIGRDLASKQSWFAQLAQPEWRDPVFGASEVWTYREISRRGTVVRVAMRAEFYEPLLSVSRQSTGLVQYVETGNGRTVPMAMDSRPIWIKSAVEEMDFDCKANRVRKVQATAYQQHGLVAALKPEDTRRQPVMTPAPGHFTWQHFSQVCQPA